MIRLRVQCLLSMVILIWEMTASGAGMIRPTITAEFTKKAPRIDGRLDDPAWKDCKHEGKLDVFKKKEDSPAPQPTVFKVLYDDQALYIGVKCHEPETTKMIALGEFHDCSMSQDDSIEIFICPIGTGFEYYQFMINARGTLFDLYVREKGNIKSSIFDSLLEIKTFIGQDFWSLEARIPFYTFNETGSSELAQKWLFNVCRTRRAGNVYELYVWAPVQDGFHDPDRFGYLNFSEGVDISSSLFHFKKFVIESGPGKDGQINATVKTELENDSGRKRELVCHAEIIGKKNHSDKVELSLDNKQTAELELKNLMVPGEGQYFFLIKVFDKQTGKLCALYRTKEKVKYRVCELEIIRPFYRNSIYPDENIREIKGILVINDPEKVKEGKVTIRLIKNKKVLQEKTFKITESKVPFTYDASKLAVGDYQITAPIVKNGKTVAEANTELHKLPPFKGTITRIDENLNLVVNGRPRINTGWYGNDYLMGRRTRDVETLPRVVLLTLGINFDKAVRYNLLSFGDLQIGRQCPKVNEKKDSELPEEAKKKIREIIEKWQHHPGLGGWYLSDEPGSRGASPVFTKNLYEYVKKLDPYHVTLICCRHPEKFIECSDVFCPHPYLTPIIRKDGTRTTRLPMTKIRDLVRKSLELGKRKKSVWVTTECHSYRMRKEDATQPDFDQERCELYTALVNGAKGFMPYTRHEAWDSYETRYALHTFYQTLFHLEPALIHGKRVPLKVESPGNVVDAMMIKYKGKLYIITVNTSEKECEAKFQSKALTKTGILTLIRENRAVQLKDGGFSDKFKGLEVHLYTTDRLFPMLENISETKALIEWKKRHTKNSLLYNDNNVIVQTNSRNVNPMALFNGTIDHPPWSGTYMKDPKNLYLDVFFPETMRINRVVVYTPTLIDFDLLAAKEGKWELLSSVKDNTLIKVEHKFEPVETSKIRLRMHKWAGTAEINEIAVFDDTGKSVQERQVNNNHRNR